MLLIILLAAIADFFMGSVWGPKSSVEYARGFVGYNGKHSNAFRTPSIQFGFTHRILIYFAATVLRKNMWRDYRSYDNVEHNFFSVLAIFFPAATGILAGANISGDLKVIPRFSPRGYQALIRLIFLPLRIHRRPSRRAPFWQSSSHRSLTLAWRLRWALPLPAMPPAI